MSDYYTDIYKLISAIGDKYEAKKPKVHPPHAKICKIVHGEMSSDTLFVRVVVISNTRRLFEQTFNSAEWLIVVNEPIELIERQLDMTPNAKYLVIRIHPAYVQDRYKLIEKLHTLCTKQQLCRIWIDCGANNHRYIDIENIDYKGKLTIGDPLTNDLREIEDPGWEKKPILTKQSKSTKKSRATRRAERKLLAESGKPEDPQQTENTITD